MRGQESRLLIGKTTQREGREHCEGGSSEGQTGNIHAIEEVRGRDIKGSN